MKKTKIIVIFGGKSVEHEISLLSAKNIIAALDKNKYDVIPVGITKRGLWVQGPTLLKLAQNATPTSQVPSSLTITNPTNVIASAKTNFVIFPVLHGTNGEDGTIQGFFEMAGVPYVGAGVLGSAVGMDKDVQKRILRDTKIPIAPFLTFTDPSTVNCERVISTLGLPVFVKPANLGSSVGVHKIESYKALKLAVKDAFRYDRKILIEAAIVGREIEISILGNEHPIASLPGEVITSKVHDFYSYEAKYLDENGAQLVIPAKLSKSQVSKIQKTAISAYIALCCEGMARADMFLTKSGQVYINEINTIPGFTNISMYPKLWEASGLSQTKLIDRLIRLALDRFKKESRLKVSF